MSYPRTALIAGAAAALLIAGSASAKAPPPARGPIATVGNRTVESLDIVLASQALGAARPATTTPRAWRRYLLDRCVDRELLAAEAERRGSQDDPHVRDEIAKREYLVLKRELEAKVLIPDIIPSPTEFAQIKKDGLYQYIDLYYILIRDDASGGRRLLAEKIASRVRAGASWDSLARTYSGHPPSAAAGGHFGPSLVRDVSPEAYAGIIAGKPGDVFGPYSSPFGHDIYRLGGFIPISDDSLMRLLVDERTRQIWNRQNKKLLEKYHARPDSTQIAAALRAFGSESPDSILASLGPDGTRPAMGVRPALGVLERVDGDSVTMRDIIRSGHIAVNEHNRAVLRSGEASSTAESLPLLCARVMLPRLLVRDALERGLQNDPAVARELRMIRDREATVAMVERARPADPDSAALRAYIDSHASRYRLAPARLTRVIMYSDQDSARAALRSWNGIGIPADSVLAAGGIRVRARGSVETVFPGDAATVPLYEDGRDPLSTSVRGLDPGQFAPVTAVPQGWAVLVVSSREEARPMTYREASPRALRDWREEQENQWVTELLERLRAKIPVKIVPTRLEAVRLAETAPGAGSRR